MVQRRTGSLRIPHFKAAPVPQPPIVWHRVKSLPPKAAGPGVRPEKGPPPDDEPEDYDPTDDVKWARSWSGALAQHFDTHEAEFAKAGGNEGDSAKVRKVRARIEQNLAKRVDAYLQQVERHSGAHRAYRELEEPFPEDVGPEPEDPGEFTPKPGPAAPPPLDGVYMPDQADYDNPAKFREDRVAFLKKVSELKRAHQKYKQDRARWLAETKKSRADHDFKVGEYNKNKEKWQKAAARSREKFAKDQARWREQKRQLREKIRQEQRAAQERRLAIEEHANTSTAEYMELLRTAADEIRERVAQEKYESEDEELDLLHGGDVKKKVKALGMFGMKGRWVTIPANGPGGGGSPVYLSDAGEIVKGPEGMVGKEPDELEEPPEGFHESAREQEDSKPEPPQVEKIVDRTDALPAFKSTSAKFHYDTSPGVNAKDAITKILGREVGESVLAGIANAPDGVIVNADVGATVIATYWKDENGSASRTIKRERDGSLSVHNESFKIEKDSDRKGTGIDVFVNQVQALKLAGVGRINTHAAGRAGSSYNGYYTWPRFGYDGTIEEDDYDGLPEQFRQKLGNSRSILDLYEIPGGKEAWKQYGGDIYDAHFDLSDGSRSMKVLKAYLKERKQREPREKSLAGTNQGNPGPSGTVGPKDGRVKLGRQKTVTGTHRPDRLRGAGPGNLGLKGRWATVNGLPCFVKGLSAYAEGVGGALVKPAEQKAVGRPYGYVINHDFRCADCADGFDEEDRDKPVYAEPYQGDRCSGCGQVYLGNHEWGSSREWRDRGKSSYFSDCERDEGGQCLPSGEQGPAPIPEAPQAEKVESLLNRFGRAGWDAFKKAGLKARHLEHVASEFLKSGVDARIKKLPPKLRPVVAGLWKATKLGTKAAFYTYLKGQNAAAAVAQASGLGDEKAGKLKALCTALDLVGAKAVPLTLTALGLPGVGMAGSLVPVGSLTYLAYSTARNPAAVAKAAKKAIRAMTGRKDKRLPGYRVKGGSYFADCERDEGGQCLPSGQAGRGKPEPPSVEGAPKKERAKRGEMVGGVRREGTGKDARVVMKDGSPAPAHIKPSMIPPAWEGVKISMDPDADVLVTAKDAKGRAKTVYNEKYLANNQAAKFAKIREGLVKFKEIAEENQKNRSDPKLKEAADAVWLMQEQATRPGSEADTKGLTELYGKKMAGGNVEMKRDKKGKISMALKFGDKKIPVKDQGTAEEIARRLESGESLEDSTYWLKSHGATTLEGRHVVETDDGVRLRFVGKEGVWHDHKIRNPELAKMLKERKKTSEERGGKLFGADYGEVTKYAKTLDGGKFTPKDFRTMKATSMALEEINSRGDCCQSPEEYKKIVMEIATKVSGVLGNRPQQALESYIAPEVWSVWRGKEE